MDIYGRRYSRLFMPSDGSRPHSAGVLAGGEYDDCARAAVTAGGIPTEEFRRALFLFLVWQRSPTIWRSAARRGDIMEATCRRIPRFRRVPYPNKLHDAGRRSVRVDRCRNVECVAVCDEQSFFISTALHHRASAQSSRIQRTIVGPCPCAYSRAACRRVRRRCSWLARSAPRSSTSRAPLSPSASARSLRSSRRSISSSIRMFAQLRSARSRREAPAARHPGAAQPAPRARSS